MSHRARRWGRAGGLTALLWWSSACGDDDAPVAAVPLPCDIREGDCQRAVFLETARLREQKGAKLPHIRVITREQYAMETRQMLAQQVATRGGEILQGVLRLLRFLPVDTSVGQAVAEANITGVAAYYNKRDKRVTIIEDPVVEGAAIPDATARASSATRTLSHEFVHALQDQREDLTVLDDEADSADGALAIDCLVEGEAVVLSDMLLVRLRDATFRPDFESYFDRMLGLFLEDVAMSTAPLTLSLSTLAYPVGGRPLAQAFLAEGMPGILRYYAKRPRTLTSWVGGDHALPRALRCAPPAAPAGYELVGLERFGGAGLISLFTRIGLGGRDAFEAARAWRSDAFAFYATPMNAPLQSGFAWRIALADPSAAANLEGALLLLALPQVAITRTEEELLIAGATDPSMLAAWTNRTDCSVPKSRGVMPTEHLLEGPLGDLVFRRGHHP